MRDEVQSSGAGKGSSTEASTRPLSARQLLLESEARTWLRKGYNTPERVAVLAAMITEKRGSVAANRLIEEMRRQWQRRADWMQEHSA